jgi:hypothetical protein
MKTVTMYRPTGQAEYDLLAASDFRQWPPRLPEQPIFYPVTNLRYAQEIAEKWNTKDPNSGMVGYVFRFEVNESFAGNYETHCVGASYHAEWWIPAEDLSELNGNIVGRIELVDTFRPES